MKQLTHGSLFAGIGGFDLGFERAGMETIWQVEIDEYCRRVLAKHWPNVQRFNDVRECGAANLTRVDVISGGFPCQDISTAGKGAGIAEGTRSGLWSEYFRIICELRPSFVVVENVSALLFRGMGRVLGDLAACGYDAEWQVVPACSVGAPHIRERVWTVAYPNSDQVRCNDGRLPAQEGRELQNDALRGVEGLRSDVANAVRSGLPERHEQRGAATQRGRIFSRSEFERTSATGGREQWKTEPNVGRVANGVPARVDRLKGLGNAIVPQIAEWIGRRIIEVAQ